MHTCVHINEGHWHIIFICRLAAVETSRRRAFILMNPHSFRRAHPHLGISTPSVSTPRLFLRRKASSSSFNWSMLGTVLSLWAAIRLSRGTRRLLFEIHVVMSWPAGVGSTAPPLRRRSRSSSHASHSLETFSMFVIPIASERPNSSAKWLRYPLIHAQLLT